MTRKRALEFCRRVITTVGTVEGGARVLLYSDRM